MTALIPVLATRTIGALVSTERIAAIARSWYGAELEPYHASLVIFTRISAPRLGARLPPQPPRVARQPLAVALRLWVMKRSFDQVIGEGDELLGNFEAKDLCCPEIDPEFELRRPFDRNVSWLGTFEYLIN